jgi:hypothetical protein
VAGALSRQQRHDGSAAKSEAREDWSSVPPGSARPLAADGCLSAGDRCRTIVGRPTRENPQGSARRMYPADARAAAVQVVYRDVPGPQRPPPPLTGPAPPQILLVGPAAQTQQRPTLSGLRLTGLIWDPAATDQIRPWSRPPTVSATSSA